MRRRFPLREPLNVIPPRGIRNRLLHLIRMLIVSLPVVFQLAETGATVHPRLHRVPSPGGIARVHWTSRADRVHIVPLGLLAFVNGLHEGALLDGVARILGARMKKRAIFGRSSASDMMTFASALLWPALPA